MTEKIKEQAIKVSKMLHNEVEYNKQEVEDFISQVSDDDLNEVMEVVKNQGSIEGMKLY